MNDLTSVRKYFPLLERKRADGRSFIYLDSAGTSLKPQPVIDAITRVLTQHSANVHRSLHQLGDEATALYEGARRKVARFIGAEEHEVVFVRNTTEALNLLAHSWKRKGRAVVSLSEHHSNLLPWGNGVTRLQPLPNGTIDLEALDRELSRGDVSVVSLSHVSNVSGALIDAKSIATRVHSAGAILILDGAQSVPHRKTDVRELDCDFLAFSGHKMCGPSGIGVLYGKAENLAKLDLFLRGGETVERVLLDSVLLKQPPWRFEAGTPAIEAAVGLGAAADFLESVGLEAIEKHEQDLVQHGLRALQKKMPTARILGPKDQRHVGPISLVFGDISSHILARTLSDSYGICVRSGFQCAQPFHECLGFPPTLRISFYLYNTIDEIDQFVTALSETITLSHPVRKG